MDNDVVNEGRRRFLTGATAVLGGVGAAFIATPFLSAWQPSAKAQAAGAPVELDIGKIEPGAMARVLWRGQPILVVHRTEAMVAELMLSNQKLLDPDSQASIQPAYTRNPARALRDNILVVVGKCTHLGCVPIVKHAGTLDADWKGGLFCPCHGSRYDMAGRVYKGMPAPENLEIPPHMYVSDTRLVVGSEEEIVA